MPSPKLQDQAVVRPVYVSLNCTESGAVPASGAASKAAAGAPSPTRTASVLVCVLAPPGPVTVKETVYAPEAVRDRSDAH